MKELLEILKGFVDEADAKGIVEHLEKADLSEKDTDRIKGALRMLSQVENMPTDAKKAVGTLAKLVKGSKDKDEKSLTDVEKRLEAIEKKLEEITKSDDGEGTDGTDGDGSDANSDGAGAGTGTDGGDGAPPVGNGNADGGEEDTTDKNKKDAVQEDVFRKALKQDFSKKKTD